MADSKLSALTEATALTDADELYVNDGGTSKRATWATVRSATGKQLDGWSTTRFSISTVTAHVTLGPYIAKGSSIAVTPGAILLGFSYCHGGTPGTVMINVVSTNTAGDDAYFVLYNYDAEGLPTTLANSWGPIDVASAGVKTLSGPETETIVEGWYWAGIFCPTGNTSSPTFTGGEAAMAPFSGAASQTKSSIMSGDTASATPPANVTSYTLSSTATATQFAPWTGDAPWLLGDA